MSPEQMFDSVAETSEYKESIPQNQFQFNPFLNTPRRDFLSKFAGQDKRTESATSILQALFMMNSKFVAQRSLALAKLLLDDGSASDAFSVANLPTMLLLDRSGHVVWSHVGAFTAPRERDLRAALDRVLKP